MTHSIDRTAALAACQSSLDLKTTFKAFKNANMAEAMQAILQESGAQFLATLFDLEDLSQDLQLDPMTVDNLDYLLRHIPVTQALEFARSFVNVLPSKGPVDLVNWYLARSRVDRLRSCVQFSDSVLFQIVNEWARYLWLHIYDQPAEEIAKQNDKLSKLTQSYCHIQGRDMPVWTQRLLDLTDLQMMLSRQAVPLMWVILKDAPRQSFGGEFQEASMVDSARFELRTLNRHLKNMRQLTEPEQSKKTPRKPSSQEELREEFSAFDSSIYPALVFETVLLRCADSLHLQGMLDHWRQGGICRQLDHFFADEATREQMRKKAVQLLSLDCGN